MDKLVQDFSTLLESGFEALDKKLQIVPGSQILLRYIKSSYQNDPIRSLFELLLLLFAIRYFLASKYSYNKKNYVQLTEKEIDELVREWEPEPLIKPVDSDDQQLIDKIPVITEHNGPIVTLEGHGDRKFLNLTTTDVYNFNNSEDMKNRAVESIRKYGVGSCGPAGFYGHQDAHGDCEVSLAKYVGCEGSLLYSQGLATESSVIPCFLKRGDIILADKAVNIAIQKGIQLSRATVFWYEHNDMDDLEKVMIRVNNLHRKGPIPRKFLVTEGLFETQGDSPDLKTLVALKTKHRFRLLLDESWSLGVLGETGRGLPEEYGLSRKDVDITVASLATAFGSAGGFCAGDRDVVDHQRITSLAYTFSATMPPYLANLTSQVVSLFSDEKFRKQHFTSLRRKTQSFNNIVSKCSLIDVTWTPKAPLFVLRISDPVLEKFPDIEGVELDKVMQRICDRALDHSDVLMSRLKMLPEYELHSVEHAIRVFVNDGLTEEQVIKAANGVVEAFKTVIQSL